MLEQDIHDYFSKPPFTNPKWPIFAYECEDEGCKLNGRFSDYIILNGDNIKRSLKRNEKSADRIIFLKESLDKNNLFIKHVNCGGEFSDIF